MNKLSVIIPCFNSGNEIVEYLFQLEKKGIDDIEFVIIDDCSTDNSYDALLSFSKKTTLKVVLLKNEVNAGPGTSRNKGIAQSTGEYITFLDADDRFTDEFFNIVIPQLECNVDLLLFDYLEEKNGNSSKKSIFNTSKNSVKTIEDVIVFVKGAPWCKIYKRNVLIDNNIKFLDQKRNEDMPFTKVSTSYCSTFKYIECYGYVYVRGNDSITSQKKNIDYKNAERAYLYIKNNLNKILNDKVIEAIFVKEYLYNVGLNRINDLSKKDWKLEIEKMMSEFPLSIKSNYVKLFPFHTKLFVRLINKKKYHTIKILKRIVHI